MSKASSSAPQLNTQNRAALRWAAKRADEWFGNVTGDPSAENHHLQMMDQVQDALFKLGIRIYKRYKRDRKGHGRVPYKGRS